MSSTLAGNCSSRSRVLRRCSATRQNSGCRDRVSRTLSYRPASKLPLAFQASVPALLPCIAAALAPPHATKSMAPPCFFPARTQQQQRSAPTGWLSISGANAFGSLQQHLAHRAHGHHVARCSPPISLARVSARSLRSASTTARQIPPSCSTMSRLPLRAVHQPSSWPTSLQ